MGRSSLAIDPQSHAMKIESRVVIARDVATIPPTGLDALRLAEQSQRAPPSRQTITLG